MVRLQQSAQTLNANNIHRIINRVLRLNDPPYSLMDTFMMIIRTILLNDIVKMLHGGQNQMVQTLGFDGFDKSFRVAVQIRTSPSGDSLA
jgi:hypothetical protein